MAWIEALSDDPEIQDIGEYRQGLVERIEGGVAIVLVGQELEEWDFPAHLLPIEAHENTVLRLRVGDGTYEVVDIDPSVPSVEERLGRGLNRKRPIVFPLPHREQGPPGREAVVDERVSRMARGLGH